MPMNREVFLSKRELNRKQVTIPEWGGESVWVRELNARERSEFETSATGGNAAVKAGLRANLVVKCSVLEDGAPMLKPADELTVNEMPGAVIDRLFTAVLEVSGMLTESEQSAVGNSSGPGQGAST